MKTDFYELFSLYTPDMEDCGSCDISSLNKLKSKVLKNIGEKKRGRFTGRAAKLLLVSAAAAACTAVTVGAVSGSFERFFKGLSQAEISDSVPDEELPAVGDNTADITPYYSLPENAAFTSEGGVSAELTGMYSDSSTVMLGMLVRTENAIDVSEARMPFYFTVVYPDGTEKYLGQSGLSGVESFVPADEENSYYLTFYLTCPDIGGCKLKAEADGIFTAGQLEEAAERLRAEQSEWRAEFESGGNTDTDEWKRYWKDNGFDERTVREQRRILSEMTPLADGKLYAETDIPMPKEEAVVTETGGITMKLDSLSLYVSDIPDELKGDSFAGRAQLVYLKDGTVFADETFMSVDGGYRQYPYIRGADGGRICCFDRPVSAAEVEKVILRLRFYDTEFNERTDEYILYNNTDS